jgi:hypothetical protein
MCTTFLKSWKWLMHSIKPVLWGLHHVQGFNLHQLHQRDHHILFQGLKRCTHLHPSYLFLPIMAILPTKLVSVTFLLKISFVITMGNRDIKKLFILPSSRNESTLITMAKFVNIFRCPSTKSQGTLAFHSCFPHQG